MPGSLHGLGHAHLGRNGAGVKGAVPQAPRAHVDVVVEVVNCLAAQKPPDVNALQLAPVVLSRHCPLRSARPTSPRFQLRMNSWGRTLFCRRR